MKNLKINYKNGNKLVEKNVYAYDLTEDYLYVSKVSNCGIADVFAISSKNIASVEEL